MTEVPSRSSSLRRLVAALDEARVQGNVERKVVAMADDSRSVVADGIFVALRGQQVDGHSFIEAALARGVCAVVHEPHEEITERVLAAGAVSVAVPDTRRAASRLASVFAEEPSKAMRVVGVTGTSGKTTTTFLIEAILNAGGVPTGRIGTLGVGFRDQTWPLTNTTPLSLELQETLRRLRSLGAQAVAMEVSSHALALDRVADVHFFAGVFTNLTRDHFDFHGTMEAYAAAKRRLFDLADIALLDIDDPHGRRWAQELRSQRRVMSFGFDESADVSARDVRTTQDGASFDVGTAHFRIRLFGRFNVSNALAAIAVARLFDVPDAVSASALEAFANVPGRMERIDGDGLRVLVDYAHKPDALERVLSSVREINSGRTWTVFGCGGGRDRGKRPEMGRIAERLSDRVIVTSDNPRGEAPQVIVDEILAGMLRPDRAIVELDRRRAISVAIEGAASGDMILVAGKGHEPYQIIGDRRQAFDDRDEVRAALKHRTRGRGIGG
ncbi:MAG TPA: UDP-N-acetylmuramoyl-L-alanyl-D-glutamate--2,6-diaminopimelate ligase [Candidatus Baltobacteraceae bacterium]|jgi:UDP-N-acetylmuramoyl-L-alanyl-D-glutamate--2,6-diaminopimelate ligase|nr:UDP-N-acetylmuramoyl-L-alanyl-D-glutamate--2,6-diaminopimelate ligase [Candidatus Baltobacteraceae bacterium]